MKLHHYVFSALLSQACLLGANAQYYRLNTTVEPYSDLQSPITINDHAGDYMNETYNVKINYKFPMYGKEISTSSGNGITVYRDGYLVDANLFGMVIEPYYALLNWRDESSLLAYEITGTFPQRILKFEWKNMALVGHPASDFISLQTWIHEETGVISMRIGPNNVTDDAAFIYSGKGTGPEIGLLRWDPTTQSFPDKVELIGDPENPELVEDVFRCLDGPPVEGMVYSFYPPEVPIPEPQDSTDQLGLAPQGSGSYLLDGVTLFPNPANDLVYVNVPDMAGFTVSVFDHTGKDVRIQERPSHAGIELDVKSLPPGVYICRVSLGESVVHRKFILSE